MVSSMTSEKQVGDESVVIGTPPGHVGDRSVVIGPTDSRGNVRIGGGVAVGYNANADATSVAIGAHAGAGTAVMPRLAELRVLFTAAGETDGANAAAELAEQLRSAQPNATKVARCWDVVKVAATTNEALLLVHTIARTLGLRR
jgi:hypothetical protein